MFFNELNEKDIETIYPNNGINIKEMSGQEKNEYLKVYNTYRKLFTEYIIKKMDLKKYDSKISNSGLNYLANSDEKMDIYQYFSCNELKYLYIRNNVYVERLTDEEKKYLLNMYESGNTVLDNNSENLIDRTYKNITFEKVFGDENEYDTLYGPDSRSFLAPNNAIVIGINYDEFNLNGLTDDKWDELHDKQEDYIYDLMFEIQRELLNQKKENVSVLKYNIFSTVKREEINRENDNEKKNEVADEEEER